MTARQYWRISWAVAAAAALLGAGGCTRVKTAWKDLTGPLPAEPVAAADTPPAPVTQGDDGSGAAAAANAPASIVADASPSGPAALPPDRAPVINVFGELDGQENKARPDSGDVAFQQHTFADEGYDADVQVDPTGKWLAYASTRHAEKPAIYLQRVDGTTVTQLTNDPSDNSQPVFSPDGKSVAFCSTRSGTWDLYTMDLDGRNVVQVTSGPSQDMHPSFSPDGGRLVYCSMGGKSGQWELWTVSLTTREKRMIGYGLFPTWSPDKAADRIAFQRARQRGSRWFSLWTLDLVDGEARRVTEVAVSSNAAIISPSWSPDARRLAFSTVVDPAQMNKGKPRGQQDVWVVDADGANRHRLTDGNGVNLSPCWAADGRVYFISDRGGHENVWSARTAARPAWPMAGGARRPETSAKSPGAGTELGSVAPELEK